MTGAVVNPGDATYAATALATSNLATEFAGLSADDDSTTSSTITVTTDSIIAPYAIVDSDTTYFAFGAANTDGFDHFKSLEKQRKRKQSNHKIKQAQKNDKRANKTFFAN